MITVYCRSNTSVITKIIIFFIENQSECDSFYFIQPKSILPKEMRGLNFAMDLVTETVALIEISENDVNEKLKGMPCIVTSYKVKITATVIRYLTLVDYDYITILQFYDYYYLF